MFVLKSWLYIFLANLVYLQQAEQFSKSVYSQTSYDALSKIINQLNERLILAQGTTIQDYPNAETDDGEWVVQIDGGLDQARWIASLTGSRLLGKMKGFEHMYIMQNSKKVSPVSGTLLSELKRSKRQAKDFPDLLQGMKQVTFVEHQLNLLRHKRSAIKMPSKILKYVPQFNDPLFIKQWQLHEIYLNTAEDSSFAPIRMDHQISDAWQLGYTGRGVVVTIIDDGIDYTHSDLADNYDPKASYDLNDNDPDPMPSMDETNSHGTRCAGEVAMTANNLKCGVGVAFNAKIGGIRILDGKLNDRMEAEAFTFGLGHIDIMSISWGPKDDGKTAEKPGRLSQMALEKGVNEGRNGSGTIYVWASGNGGLVGDDCAADGYASSVHSFTVSAVASDGSVPWYAEQCSSTLVSTYSTGHSTHRSVIIFWLVNVAVLDAWVLYQKRSRMTSAHSGNRRNFLRQLNKQLRKTQMESRTPSWLLSETKKIEELKERIQQKSMGKAKCELYRCQIGHHSVKHDVILTCEVTTNPGNTCTENHTGTSAATPIAVGIIALSLEANPHLTWRDLQHIALWTADPSPSFTQTKDEWQINAAGFLFHPKIGFGLMNALQFVQTAKQWEPVPKQSICITEYANFKTKNFINSTTGTIKFTTTGCRNEQNEVRFIEHVQLVLDIEADIRGHVSLWLRSPEGTLSQLLSPRPLDVTNEGFKQWPFTTVHMWGENPSGLWTLHVKNGNLWQGLESNISIKTIKLVVFGTKQAPLHYMEPRQYNYLINEAESPKEI